MSCQRYNNLLDEYLNNELDEQLHGSISAHLDKCAVCQEEIRFLSLESGLYRKISTLSEENLTNQWDAMRNRLIAESLIKNEVLPEREKDESRLPFPFVSAFLVRLENLFLANKPVFGIFLLIVFGFITVFLLNNKSADDELIAAIEPEKKSETEISLDLPEDNVSQPDKIIELDETKFNNQKKTNLAGKTLQNSQIRINEKKTDSAGNGKKRGKVTSPVKSGEKLINTDSSSATSRLPLETINADFRSGADDKKLANYLNKVHLFLLMFRNLENDEIINEVIGDKYQTEARMFLDNNSVYKKELLRKRNIPAAELLNRIEPVLKAISNLDEQSGIDNIYKVTAMVKQTGIVFKMRLWMSNIKSAEESRL